MTGSRPKRNRFTVNKLPRLKYHLKLKSAWVPVKMCSINGMPENFPFACTTTKRMAVFKNYSMKMYFDLLFIYLLRVFWPTQFVIRMTYFFRMMLKIMIENETTMRRELIVKVSTSHSEQI